MRISIFNSRELQGVVVAMQGADKEIGSQLRKATRTVVGPAWSEEVAKRASTRLERRVLASTARVTVSNQNVVLKSAQIGKTMTGGAKPSGLVGPVEFGSNRTATKTYSSTSRKGRPYEIRNRQTQRQFKPYTKRGHVAYPAAAKTIPRIASLWVQTIVRTFYETIERR